MGAPSFWGVSYCKEHPKDELYTVLHIEPVEHSSQVRPQGRNSDLEIGRDLLVAHSTENSLHNPRFLRRKGKSRHDMRPSRAIERERQGRAGGLPSWMLLPSASHRRCPENKEGVEPRTLTEPPPGGAKNVPRPTPLSGRGTRHCFFARIWRFSVKQRLDAHASNQIVAFR